MSLQARVRSSVQVELRTADRLEERDRKKENVIFVVTLSLSVPLHYVRGQCFQQLSVVQWYLFGHLTAYTPTHAKH